MVNFRQIEKRAKKVLGLREKRLFLIMIIPSGDGWILREQYWDGVAHSYTPETDSKETYFDSLEQATTAAETLKAGTKKAKEVPVIIADDPEQDPFYYDV